jgi:hypothetical protein
VMRRRHGFGVVKDRGRVGGCMLGCARFQESRAR